VLAIIERTLRALTGRKTVGILLVLAAAAQTASSVTLAWDPIPESWVAGYAVRYGTASGYYSSRVDTRNATTVTLTNLTVGTTYYFVANAYTADGQENPPSNEVSYTVPAQTPTEPTNAAPVVNAGPDRAITLPASATLAATVTDDGLPAVPGNVSVAWIRVSGPGTISFANAASANTTASFTAAGTYILRLTATDGSLASSDDLVITAQPTPPQSPLAISMEAESGNLVQPMAVATSAGGITQPKSTTYITSAVAGQGSATYDVPIASAGSYVVWVRFQTSGNTNASLYLASDITSEKAVQASASQSSSAWRWACLTAAAGGIGAAPGGTRAPLTLNFTAGYHTLSIRNGDQGVAFDKFLVTNDRNFVPTDAAPAQVVPPSISNLMFPANGAWVTWTAISGATYRLLYKDNLMDSQWLPASPDLVATTTQLSWFDETAGATSRRFYTTVLLR
jgi:hypothetical protein